MGASLKDLIETALHGDDAAERREAIIELGYREDAAIYDVLVSVLDDPNKSLRHAATISLGRYGNAEAIEELIKPKILNSPMVNIRWAAVSAITSLGDFRIIDHLLKAVEDPEWIVHNQAVTGLKAKIREILAIKDIRNSRFLIRMLALQDREIVEMVKEGFVEIGQKSVPVLRDALRSASPVIRKNAACAIGRIGAAECAGSLIVLLSDDDWRVRRSAAEALGNLKRKEAIEPLVQSLSDNVSRVRQEAIESLVKYGRLSTRSLLNALSHQKNKFVLRAIIYTLGEIRDIKAADHLYGHLKSSYFVVRIAAARALIKYGPDIIEPLLPLLSYNRSSVSALMKDALKSGDLPSRLRAIKALGGLEEHRAVGLLKKLVEEGEEEVQEAASAALVQIGLAAWGRCGVLIIIGETGDEKLLPVIRESLRDDSDNVRLEALRAIAKIGGEEAVNSLVEAARKDRDAYIRTEAMRNLRRIGVGFNQVLDLALEKLKDESRNVRAQAARLLGNFHDDRSIQPLLRKTADPHWSVRESAECALLNFGSSAVPKLIAALSSKSWTTRFRAARLLGHVGDDRAVGPLKKLLQKKGERKIVRDIIQLSLDKLAKKSAA